MSINLNAILVNQMLLTQFIEYIQLYKNFETSYDQILQPQKRLVIRRLLEATMGRMIELKHELVKHQLNYIQFHEPVLKVKSHKQWFAKDWRRTIVGLNNEKFQNFYF